MLDAVGASSSTRASFDYRAYENRFAQVRGDIAPGSPIGYLTDADPNLASTSAEYYLAQYALAPVAVANSADRDVVLANVHTPQPEAFYRSRGLELVRDYGNGVMLLRKAAR